MGWSKGLYSYEFGDWRTHCVKKTTFANELADIVFFRTCSDTPVVSNLDKRMATCLILANRISPGMVTNPRALGKDVYEADSSGVFSELLNGSIAIICDSNTSVNDNGCSVICKGVDDKAQYRF